MAKTLRLFRLLGIFALFLASLHEMGGMEGPSRHEEPDSSPRRLGHLLRSATSPVQDAMPQESFLKTAMEIFRKAYVKLIVDPSLLTTMAGIMLQATPVHSGLYAFPSPTPTPESITPPSDDSYVMETAIGAVVGIGTLLTCCGGYLYYHWGQQDSRHLDEDEEGLPSTSLNDMTTQSFDSSEDTAE